MCFTISFDEWLKCFAWFMINRKITYHFVTKIFHNTVEVSGLPSIWCNVTFSSVVKIRIRNCSIIVVIWNVFVNTWNIYRKYLNNSKYSFDNNLPCLFYNFWYIYWYFYTCINTIFILKVFYIGLYLRHISRYVVMKDYN